MMMVSLMLGYAEPPVGAQATVATMLHCCIGVLGVDRGPIHKFGSCIPSPFHLLSPNTASQGKQFPKNPPHSWIHLCQEGHCRLVLASTVDLAVELNALCFSLKMSILRRS